MVYDAKILFCTKPAYNLSIAAEDEDQAAETAMETDFNYAVRPIAVLVNEVSCYRVMSDDSLRPCEYDELEGIIYENAR